MDISVIIPCHNLEDYIGRCLKSILSQQYYKDKFEIIMVFDTCNDDSKRIARELLQERTQDKIATVNFRSPGLTRNIGLELATGKYVWFIDGDDFLTDTRAFSKLVGKMEETQASAIYLKRFDSERPIQENWAVWRFFYQRSFIGGIRFPDLPIDEDIKFFYKVSKQKGFCVTLIEDVLYHHTFPRKGSIVTERDRRIIGKV